MNHQVELDRVHLIGIGGAGMSGVARILLDRGAQVSGSDAQDSATLQELAAAGAAVAVGHDRANLLLSGQEPTVVVTSFAAIPQDNPELQEARERAIPVIRRSDLLGELMEGYQQVLIAGTHGKTSTTSMAVAAMRAAELDPSFAIGGQLTEDGINAHHGAGEAFIAEADESDASLLRYRPDIAVITNVEPDHLDFFDSAASYFQVFDDFAAKVSSDGHLVVCANDDNAVAVGQRAAGVGVSVLGYGTTVAFTAHPEVRRGVEIISHQATEHGTEVVVTVHVDRSGAPVDNPLELQFQLSVPGEHMMLNAAAALLAGVLAGGEPEALARGLSNFGGVKRRFEHRGTVAAGHFAGTRVFDDYAHHPTEVTAVLTAARSTVDAEGRGARVVACFQPHLYSRTQEFAAEFGEALALADAVVVMEIFGARETPREGVDSRLITQAMPAETMPVIYEPDFDATPARVVSLTKPGDVVLTLGAGSVTSLAGRILKLLEEK